MSQLLALGRKKTFGTGQRVEVSIGCGRLSLSAKTSRKEVIERNRARQVDKRSAKRKRCQGRNLHFQRKFAGERGRSPGTRQGKSCRRKTEK